MHNERKVKTPTCLNHCPALIEMSVPTLRILPHDFIYKEDSAAKSGPVCAVQS